MLHTVGMVAGATTLLATLSPVMVQAVTFPMTHAKIELNATVLSSPSRFTYQKTSYMPLFYVQQLLNKLNLQNSWNGKTWRISTSFSNQPTFLLKTKSGQMSISVNGKTLAAHVEKVVTIDPASKQKTTFIPVWYIIQALDAIGLKSTWNGTTWDVTSIYSDVSKTGKTLGAFSTLPAAQTALLDYPGGQVKDKNGQVVYTESSFTNVDLRYPAPSNVNATSLNRYLSHHAPIMSGLGQTFMKAQSQYGVDANYLVSHAIEETGSNGNVSDIALNKNNLFGYGAFDANASSDAGTFPSEAYAILFQAWEVRNNYLNPSSSHYVEPTLSGLAANYASDPQWATKVNNLMDQLAIDMKDNVSSYKPYAKSNTPIAPAGSQNIPVYDLNGARGTVGVDVNYGNNIPVYTDGGAGHQHMFVRNLQLNDQGNDVQTLQQALNSAGSNIKADGIFGPATQTALEQYQTDHGLSATGVCDFGLWNNTLNLSGAATTVPAGQTISIDEIVEGMVGGQVTEWYHIPNLGWIDAQDVTLTNVYRLMAPNAKSSSDASIPVTNGSGQIVATLHTGDYVVAANASTSSGKVNIQFVNQDSGQAMTGYIKSTRATLKQVKH